MIAALPSIGLDELTARAGLLTRVDRKYVVPRDRLSEIVASLPSSTQVLEIDGRRQFGYRSVYFDTPDLISFRGAAQRRRRRFKIRTRRYVDSGLRLLEVKTRGPRGTTVKERVPYSGDGSALSVHDRRASAAALSATVALDETAVDSLRAALITDYQRATLYLPDSQSRVTIDLGLAWSLPNGDATDTLRRLAVVETKCVAAPAEMDRVLWQRRFRPRPLSKYCTGLALLRPDLPSHRWNPTIKLLTTKDVTS